MDKQHNRSFWALMVTQFLGAFNDNVFQIVVALLFIRWLGETEAQKMVAMSAVVFAGPFILFSLGAGRLADRWSKRKILVLTKSSDLIIVTFAIAGIYLKSIPVILAGLFLLGIQSTFFGPAKFGILPEIKSEGELSAANGFLNGATVVAILLGNIVGTFIIDSLHLIAIITGLVAVGSFLGSFMIEKTPAMNPQQPLEWNPFTDFFRNWALISKNKALRLSMIAVSFFWFMGGVLHLNTLTYVKHVMKLSDQHAGILLSAIVIGVTLGSVLAGKLSQGKIELGLVPLGAIGMSLFTLDLFFSHASLHRTLFDAFVMGLSSGFYVVPLSTLIQVQSPDSDRGRILATSNFLTFIAIAGSGGFLWCLKELFNTNPAQVFLIVGILSVFVTGGILFFLPQAFVRLILFFISNSLYHIRTVGRDNVPMKGPALLVPNHVSMVDPFFISGSLSRSVRFMMFREMYEKPLLHWFVKFMDVIPVSEKDNPKEILRSLLQARKKLEEGHVVCIFAEGQISRQGGFVMGFKRGIEVILKDLDVPVIPVHIEGAWGSIFSFKGNKWIWKWPKRFPYPVTITFGKPMKGPKPAEIRQEVMDLGSEAFAAHRREEPTLFESVVGQSKWDFFKKAVADSSGAELNYIQLLTATALVGKKLMRPPADPQARENVGILLPPSVGAVIANLALMSRGCVPINLNYTLSQDAVDDICQRASIQRIVTSAKMLEKLGWPLEIQKHILLESLTKFNPVVKVLTAFVLAAMPKFLLKRTYFRRSPRKLDDIATIMFTSGSTGIPKGVVLTQANILSNLQAITMVLKMDSKDVLMGVLPFFHSFGYTATLWFPLVSGFKGVYHTNPLDSKTIGELCRTNQVTFLMGTPTFLSAYLRKVPKEDFASLRLAIAGAEKLRPELAQAFEEKFNVPIMEGYGCTELSPVVAINVPDTMDGDLLQVGRKVGKIGRPIPGISVKVVDPETFAARKPGESGLLVVKGPNVMKEYLNDPEKTKEAIHDGWYVTGDIAAFDEDGFIEITDRLSRFSKIGGEMVPHIKVEEKLQELAKAIDRQFIVSSVPDEKKGEALVVLVSGFTGDLDQLVKSLNATDLPKLWIPDRDKFFVVEALPVLGSGKIDMQSVKKIVQEKINAK